MDAWDVYWIMQMDDIRGFMVFLGCASGIATGLLFTFFGCAAGDEAIKDGSRDKAAIYAGRVALAGIPLTLLFALLASFLPSTKTLAAMYAVPAVVNNEELQADFSEVYELGMERIKDVLSEEPQETKE